MTTADIRLGRWQDVLADVDVVDALICDPPYSARTHGGAASLSGGRVTTGVSAYPSWSLDDAQAFIDVWVPRCQGWMVLHTDDHLGVAMVDMLRERKRYAFPLVPVLQHMPRIQGDGPGSPGHFLVVSRPSAAGWNQWGSLPCWYEAPREKNGVILGCKPLSLMRAIVRDYSRPGDLVCDPFCGSGTTAVAALTEGRRIVGSEMDPKHHAITMARLARGHTPNLFADA